MKRMHLRMRRRKDAARHADDRVLIVDGHALQT